MHRFSAALLLLAVGVAPAAASGGLSCEGKGQGASFSVEGGVTRGMGAPVFNFRGSSSIASKAVAPDLRRYSYTQEHLAQYWLDGDELRLVVYRERDAGKPHGYVQFTVLTKGDDEGTYTGTFAMSVFDGVDDVSQGKTAEFAGKVTCFVE
jgi:hypothetical protein